MYGLKKRMDKGGIMVEQELKEMIRTRYGSLAAFCQKINSLSANWEPFSM